MVPALRFPEFQNAGEWKKKPLAPYIEQYSEKVSSSTELEVYSSTREGLKPQSEYYDGRNLVNDGEYGVVPTGYFVYRHMSDDDVFKFNLNQLGKKIAVSKEYPVFKTVNIDARFLLNKLNEGQEFKKFAVSQKKGGTRTRLYFKTLRTFESFLPAFEEQQKIADCLTSVDELITAQTQKLDALKTHKKGLMQQLFPAEGETVPIRRFPEFDDVLKTVGFAELGEIKIGLTHKPEYIESGKSFLSSRNISNGYIDFENIKYISEEKFSSMPESTKPKVGDILFTRVGSNLGNPIILEEDREFGIFVSLGIFRVNKDVSNYYVKHWMDSDFFWGQVKQKVAGGAKDNLNTTWLKEFKLSIPSFAEQQKIADCLSSIDRLINAQAQKLEALKTHKRGLTQQLFPAVDEAG